MSNAVQYDRQWVRRIIKEENMLSAAMKQQEDDMKNAYEEQKYIAGDGKYSQYSGASKSAIDRAFAKEYGDDLELSSKWSVATPKTHITGKSNKSIGKTSIKSKSISKPTSSQYTSQTAKQKVMNLEKILQDEKKKRQDVEKQIEQLKNDLLKMKP